ncbi:transcriptional regulator with PAS, ATPase and Fis domain [Sedimentibacter acidaminivorans]|uniref:Transcriptional regulator with PAS, ATPase and Fis domain n=1 Tax=Sedimentibacter acidaminivorans TaxID=913099 RepID=A0ABS4GF54_9FIRM|nr:sigma 54-interacting transcriptional regulator [Sedimentibacter acidaminivorans]MBP1926309.1 transcriptional regulator with PAS, ATPase and Fis domain [Sedimentibacter acidaminivorans]
MKKVAVIYKNSDNQEVIKYLKNNLEKIFENYIIVENHYLDELPSNFKIHADAYIITDETMLYPLKERITNYNNIVTMYRSIKKQKLYEISNIPSNTNVLIINDTYETSVQTLCSLYELGMGHINLVPFDPSDADNPQYKDFKICITPNEVHLVPEYIQKTINIGYREISFETLMRLMIRLELDFELTNRNLVRHIKSIAEPNIYIYNNYLNNFVKNYVFDSVINDSPTALIITNEKYHILFSNNKAKEMFNLKSKSAVIPLSNIMESDKFAEIQEETMPKDGIIFNGIQYFIEKKPIMLIDEIMGYHIILQNEKDIRDIEINAKKMLEKKGLVAKYNFSDIIHVSRKMKECINTAKTVALTDHTVLITGESGTGKELMAQSIHNYSDRKNMSFVAINCAAIPESLLESELFGYESGSFTGAKRNGKLGLFEQANGGSIFLDEIGDISPNLQSRLLRVLQERQIMRIGSNRMISIDTRILAATNKDLLSEVEKGNFRRDLFYRLNVISICIEPLRNRREDILPLISSFLGAKYNHLNDSNKNLLYTYSWPGNIRELENTAIHYNTLSTLPKYLLNTPITPLTINNTDKPADSVCIEMEILKIIMENSQCFHGIGRLQINNYLKSLQIKIGDANLRNILQNLQERDLITIGKGRNGTKITKLGIQKIKYF